MTSRLVRRVYAADLVKWHTKALFTKPVNHKKLTETWKLSESPPFLSGSLTCCLPNIVSSTTLMPLVSPLSLQFQQSMI